jgi:MFS family permease
MGPRRALATIIAANAVSLFGNVLAAVAIPWFVLVETGDALQTGIAALFASAPLAIGAFFGGTVTDRIGPRRASVVGDLLSAISVAGIPALHLVGALEFWHLLVLAFLGALFDAPAAAAREAMLPELTKRAGVRTERVTSALTATEHGAYILGAPLAGLLIALIGAPSLLWIDAATFVVSALLVGVAGTSTARTPKVEASNYMAELIDGLRYIWRDPAILTVTLAATAGAFFIDPLSPVLLPIYVADQFGQASALGLALGAYGLGGLLGIGLFYLLVDRITRPALYRILWLAYATTSFALVALPPLFLLVPVLVLIGISAGAIDPLERAVRQERTPAELRGRVFAAMYAIPKVVVPVGVFCAGLLVEIVGLRGALLGFALGNLTIALVLAVVPSVRQLGPPSHDRAAVPAVRSPAAVTTGRARASR